MGSTTHMQPITTKYKHMNTDLTKSKNKSGKHFGWKHFPSPSSHFLGSYTEGYS